jgi:hypothetical protein
MKRRNFLQTTSLSAAGMLTSNAWGQALAGQAAAKVEIINPLNRVPVSFIIDDSTSLVNMAYYGIPQFGEVFPDNYKQDWRKLPREIPDSFVLEFIEWCTDHGVKGKYSMVPYPACTGWLHRFIPGWSKQELRESLRIVREIVSKDWDIHPEMISHTRVIDIKTGLPYPHATPEYMENWEWSQTKSADELAAYMTYAYRVLQEAGLYCEGLTTPGGFGGRNMDNLAMGTLEATREVYGVSTPHFFRNVVTDPDKSVAPEIFHASGLEGSDPKCSVHIIGCTGDWFGGWDGLTPGDPDRFITADLSRGRLVEVIDGGEPAILVCHWPGIYYNGEKIGFNIFKTVVDRLEQKYPDSLIWMKNSEIARYWAAKTLTKMEELPDRIRLTAPFPAKQFTLKVNGKVKEPAVLHKGEQKPLKQITSSKNLQPGHWVKQKEENILCFDLEKGVTDIIFKSS